MSGFSPSFKSHLTDKNTNTKNFFSERDVKLSTRRRKTDHPNPPRSLLKYKMTEPLTDHPSNYISLTLHNLPDSWDGIRGTLTPHDYLVLINLDRSRDKHPEFYVDSTTYHFWRITNITNKTVQSGDVKFHYKKYSSDKGSLEIKGKNWVVTSYMTRAELMRVLPKRVELEETEFSETYHHIPRGWFGGIYASQCDLCYFWHPNNMMTKHPFSTRDEFVCDNCIFKHEAKMRAFASHINKLLDGGRLTCSDCFKPRLTSAEIFPAGKDEIICGKCRDNREEAKKNLE